MVVLEETREMKTACYCDGDGEFTGVHCGLDALHESRSSECSYTKVLEVYSWPWGDYDYCF
jgi:hypothetical protein